MARIAIVDDQPALLEFLARLLRDRGHEVFPARDGDDALSIVSELAASPAGPPDLVISDVQMPRRDGFELCRALRERFDRKRLPVLLVSVLDAEDDILQGFESGANDYITKPYGAGMLLAKVNVLLRERDVLASGEGTRPAGERPLDGAAPPFRFDRYDVEAELGRGGMGIVYRARDRSTGGLVALKLLARDIARDRHGLARFLREFGALQRVESDRVVRALDSGTDRGHYFIAMELVLGTSAKELLRERGPLPPREVAAIGRDIALALAAISEKGIVHRDVKPANFIVKEDGRAVLVDFGLARGIDQRDLTETGEAIGTPHFLAPEVLEGGPADGVADLYALGVSLYELLAGRKPYGGRSSFEIFQRALAGEIQDLAALRPDAPPALPATIRRLLARRPGDRLQPAEVVAEELAFFS